MIPITTLWHYLATRRRRFTTRDALLKWQHRQRHRHARHTLSRSPWFRAYQPDQHDTWPLMDKRIMMAHFDQMNTAGLTRDELLSCARRAESERDFTPQVKGYSVGLSSGTSGQRGLFVVSPREQRTWAGVMLAKMLPEGLRRGERVALFLRADNRLYHSVNNRWLSLKFFDLLDSFEAQIEQAANFKPTFIVAPAQVLRALALAILEKRLSLAVHRVISVAEVLAPQDRALLERVFPRVDEVYQATEGFLAASCSHGTLHLNEEFIMVEPEWLDAHRFIPIITDFTRTTQPIVRYRLDDILVKRTTPCPCGQVSMALERIEGRCDDALLLPGSDGHQRTLFADACNRILANTLPLTADYQLTQHGTALRLRGDCGEEELWNCQKALERHFIRMGVNVSPLEWNVHAGPIPHSFMKKKRRIQCYQEPVDG